MSLFIDTIYLYIFILFCIVTSSQQQQQQIDAFKILAGDTLRLECPKLNPTWFYRSSETNIEELIVTRHGIINVQYKHKITSHPTLKHKIIFINKIGIIDDGIYSCLYTKPAEATVTINDYDDMVPPVQERFMFNVSVYTLINGLTMNIKPYKSINKKLNEAKDFFELSENVLTVKENDELLVNCIVERSKPAAQIHFQLGDDSALSSGRKLTTAASIVSSNTNIIKNDDKTFQTVNMVNLKASPSDHGKVISCNAENGLSNQKWENRRILNVLFAPICKDQENFQYFIGINQTITIECRIKNANPIHVNYEWYFKNKNIIEYSRGGGSGGDTNSQNSNNVNEGFINRIKIKPTNIQDFGEIKCQTTNDIGSTSCLYELKLGGIPNPPYDCTYTLKNSSAIIFCQLGYHQGDPDVYCFLLRKADNGVYKEHTRSRDACSFIVNDVPENKLNEFWVYTSNKFGHNKDSGVYLTIGSIKTAAVSENGGSKTLILIGSICGITIFLILACCLCFKIRKGFHDDSDSVYENELQNGKNGGAIVIANHNNEYSEKQLKHKNDYNEDETFDDTDVKDSEEMLKERKYTLKKPSFDSDEDDDLKNPKKLPISMINNNNKKDKYEPFTYDDPKMYVSYFNDLKPKETVDDIKLGGSDTSKSKKKFSFLTLKNPSTNSKTSTIERYPTPSSKRSTKFNKNSSSSSKYDDIDDADGNYEKSKTQLINDLNDKLFSIAAGLTSTTIPTSGDEEIYSTTTRRPILNKDISLNTISTQFQSDSSTSNPIVSSKLITFTSANSLNDTQSSKRADSASPSRIRTLDRPQAMTTFGGGGGGGTTITSNLYSTVKRTKKDHLSSPVKRYDSSNEIYETKFLSNLCEEIELTLNVDCMYDESSSSAQCDSNVNSELSTDSSSHNIPNTGNYNNNNNNNNNVHKIVKQRIHLNHNNNRNGENSNMIVNTSRAPNERINDYNYNHQRTNSRPPPVPPSIPPLSLHNDDFSSRNKPKNIGVLV